LIWTQRTPADPIPLWELNRHQYLITLAIAYWLTKDPKYVVATIDHLKSWIEQNTLQHGIHWFYSLEVSIRLLAWVTIFQFIRHSQLFRDQLGRPFIKYIYAQAQHVFNHLQNTRSKVPNNHLIAEATALVVIGALFPEFRNSEIWLGTGLKLLNEQIAQQIHADGVNKEQAIGYHRFVSELVLIVVCLGKHKLIEREPLLEDTLEKMMKYTSFSLTPDGSVPLWGDSDYGRALGINNSEDFWDFRGLLAMGAVLYNRAEWKYLAKTFPVEAFWQLGQAGLDAWNNMDASLPQETSRAFPDGGIYIIRDTWKRDTDVAYFRCGSFGLGGEGYCSHAHCDLLSPVLWIQGREVLVNSGTFTYFSPLRDHFRTTSAKNTLMVDGHEQATAKPFFGWTDLPEAECLNRDDKRITGEMQIRSGILHRRELNHPNPGTWEITDYVQSDAFHSLFWYFHFSPKLSLHQNEDIVLVRTKATDHPFVNIQVPSKVTGNIGEGWFSRWYGQKETNPLLQATWQGRIPPEGKEFTWRFQNITKIREDKNEH
jgi:hypothetical protein